MGDKLWFDIKQYCLSHGFDTCSVTDLLIEQEKQKEFMQFLDDERYGTMTWLAKNVEKRCNPSTLMEQAQSAIIVGVNYAPTGNVLEKLHDKDKGVISCYAHGDDYHDIIKKNLIHVGHHIHKTYHCDIRVYVDTAPLLEKVLAAQAGIGWQGKHTNLVSRQFGSWLFLGVIITSIPYRDEENHKEKNIKKKYCGTCTQCLDICPTNAFDKAYRINPTKCIAYLTIEHKGKIDKKFYSQIGNRIYGCDDCLAVCPWNKFAQKSTEMAFEEREYYKEMTLEKYLTFDDANFRAFFKKSPIKRIKHERFIRNCLIAAGNSESQQCRVLIEKWCKSDNPVLAETAEEVLEEMSRN